MSDRPETADPIQATARPVKRSFTIGGHATSISLEHAFWEALKDVAAAEGVSTASLVARIDAKRGGAGLSSAVRVWLLQRFREAHRHTGMAKAGVVKD